MLANTPADGLDILTRMATAAAERAAAQSTGALRLAGCDRLALTDGSVAADIDVESWAVEADRRKIVISVFATAPQDDGRRRMAGSARFTFTPLTPTGRASA